MKETKQCTKCQEYKLFIEFYTNKRNKKGLRSWCKECTRKEDKKYRNLHPEVGRNRMRRWRKNNPQKAKIIDLKNGLKRVLGISIEQYNNLLRAQDYKCAICGKKDGYNKRLSVDHCHQTQEIRGLLCTSCNLMLGNCHDDIEVLDSAKRYLCEGN